MDYGDAAPLLLDLLAKQPPDPYAEVIVDEAQDLRPVDLELAAAMGGGGSSQGLVLLVDPKQSIYYRGLSWKEAGVRIASARVHTLRRNFRNSRPVLEAAWSLAQAETHKPFDDEIVTPEASNRPGPKPVVVNCASPDDEYNTVRDLILSICERQLYRPGDIAVLARSNKILDAVKQRLDNGGLPVAHFRQDGFSIFENEIKVIRVHSAKGLEFPVVILVGVNEGSFPPDFSRQPEDDRPALLRVERQLMYVGMTRACQRLYITCSVKPSRFLTEIADGLLRHVTPADLKRATA